MVKNWLRYLAVLASAAVFFFCFNGYLSLYTLLLTLACPLASLLLSLPSILLIRLELALGAPSARKGQELFLRLKIGSRSPIAGGRAMATLTVRNTLTGEAQTERLAFTPCRGRQAVEHKLISPSCGQIVCELSQCRATDYLGLFPIPIRRPKKSRCTAVIYPALCDPDLSFQPVSMPDGEGDSYSPKKPGDDPSELFGLREYREGDKLSRVHWKLSQKTGQTLVREFGLPVTDHILFLLELNGSGPETDALLDAFFTLSHFLSERDAAHRVCFWDGVADHAALLEIASAEDVRPVLEALLVTGRRASLPPLSDESLPGGVSHILYLTGRLNRDLAAGLRLRMPSARLTVIQASEDSELPQPEVPSGAELSIIRPKRVAQGLNGLRL